MQKAIRWGILATGAIAHKFTKDLLLLAGDSGAVVAAVGSRSRDKAAEFAGLYGIPHVHGSYEELAADPDVDIIYVATPHPAHKDCSILCLKAGKHVLCEKPFAINARETEEVIRFARKSGLFLMEAMWTRYTPAIIKAREWLASGVIGEVKMLRADFGFRSGSGPDKRLLNLKLGGGALLDVGIYTVSLASMVFGESPSEIRSLAYIGETGVDEQSSTVFKYRGGGIASLNTAIRSSLANDAWIFGTKGRIHLPRFAYGRTAELFTGSNAGNGKDATETYSPDVAGEGYHFEASEAMRCIREDRTESVIMPLDETLAIMKTMDAVRDQWNLRYPGE